MNGEIYNYQELRASLIAAGHAFRTASDTEVLVHLYEEQGTNCCAFLRGMFAFALWDARAKKLLVARDRFGKKPLFYCQSRDGLIFASELKALRILAQALGNDLPIRQQSIYDYLSLGSIPQPATIYDTVYALPPANWLQMDERGVSIQRYWCLEYMPKLTVTYAEAQHRTRELLSEAVRLRLRSDVPLGIFLSGGMDSSAIAYEASRILGDSLKTFTVAMPDPHYDESERAQRTAKFLGCQNIVLKLQVSPLEELLRMVRVYDQPYADASAIPSLAVSRLAREHVTVILNGDGGDECLAGYRRYVAARYLSRFPRLPAWFGSLCDRAAIRLGVTARHSKAGLLVRMLRSLRASRGERYLIWTTDLLREQDKNVAWLGEKMDPSEGWIADTLSPALSGLDTQMDGDVRIILLSDLLVKMDMATMSASLEARSPFLDHVFAEFAARLPDAYKIRWGRTKAVLRDAYTGRLPPEVTRGAKAGFEIPLLLWLRTHWRELLRDTLGTSSARVFAYLDRGFVHELLEGRICRDRNWAMLVFTVFMLELWLRNAEEGIL